MVHYGGYLAFRKLVGYHRGLWVEVPQAALIRLHQHKIILPLAQHLRLDDHIQSEGSKWFYIISS